MGATTEFNRSLGSSGSSGVLLKSGNRDANGNNPDGIGVGLVENSPEALDGLGNGEGGVLGKYLFVLSDHVIGDLKVIRAKLKLTARIRISKGHEATN